MRTKKEAAKAAQKIIGLPAKYTAFDVGCCCVEFDSVPAIGLCVPIRVMFDVSIFSFSDEEQRAIFMHEKGHIVAYRTGLPFHVTRSHMKDCQAGSIIYDWSEAEADIYVAKHIGIKKTVKLVDKLCPTPYRKQYLLRLWKERKQ